MLRRSLDAFSRTDAELARAVLGEDDAIDRVAGRGGADDAARARAPARRGVSQEVDMIMVAKHLERVGDHATNIAEDVILVAEARNVKHAAKLARSR